MAEATKMAVPPVQLDIVAVVPPPLNGMTLITSQFSRVMGGHARLWPVSNGLATSGVRWSLWKHIQLSLNLLRAILKGKGSGKCYFIPDSGQGLYLNILESPLLRFGFSEVWLHHHVFSYVRSPDWRMKLFLVILGKKARHIVLGESMKVGLRENYDVRSVRVIGNAAFIEPVSENSSTNKTMRSIGFLGNITSVKGIGSFMEVIRTLSDEGHEVRAVIAGPINEQGIESAIQDFIEEAPEQRQYIGKVQGDEKAEYFDTIDVLLFPSRYQNEALPVTVYEALSCGIPVLATSIGCIPEQLANLDWVFGEASYHESAVTKIRCWLLSQDEYRLASFAAASSFNESRKSASDAIRRLTEEIVSG